MGSVAAQLFQAGWEVVDGWSGGVQKGEKRDGAGVGGLGAVKFKYLWQKEGRRAHPPRRRPPGSSSIISRAVRFFSALRRGRCGRGRAGSDGERAERESCLHSPVQSDKRGDPPERPRRKRATNPLNSGATPPTGSRTAILFITPKPLPLRTQPIFQVAGTESF